MDLSTIQMALNVIIVFETFQLGLWGALPANETTGADQIELLKIRAESIKLEEFNVIENCGGGGPTKERLTSVNSISSPSLMPGMRVLPKQMFG